MERKTKARITELIRECGVHPEVSSNEPVWQLAAAVCEAEQHLIDLREDVIDAVGCEAVNALRGGGPTDPLALTDCVTQFREALVRLDERRKALATLAAICHG